MGRWHPTKPNKHHKLAVQVTLRHNAYDKISLEAPNTAGDQHTTMVTAMPDTGASMCLVGRCLTMGMGITRHNLAATTERGVGVNGGRIKLDGIVFLNLTLGNDTSNQIV